MEQPLTKDQVDWARMVQAEGGTLTWIARSLGMTRSDLTFWLKEYDGGVRR